MSDASPLSDPESVANEAAEVAHPEESEIIVRLLSANGVAETHQQIARQGWSTEVLHERTNARLKKLATLMERPAQLKDANASDFAGEEFSCPPLIPTELDTAYSGEGVTVRRASDEFSRRAATESLRIHEALVNLLSPLVNAEDIHVKFKQFKIQKDGTHLTTAAYYQASGRLNGSMLQQNALCTFGWTLDAKNNPKLNSIALENYEEIETEDNAETLFSDCTEAVLGANKCFGEQLIFGQEYWLRRRQLALGIDNVGHRGLATGDVNGDGRDDLYVCQTGGLPNRLFVQNADGTATDISAQAGVDFMERTHSALLLDLDNDGDQDMILATSESILVLANDGEARFALMNEGRFANAYSLAAADYDEDGDLDIYACFYVSASDFDKNAGLALHPIPYHDANNGARNLLFRNDGDWRFSDVTAEVGLDVNNRRWSFAAAWEDYDNDGDVDLYVANDYGRNNLYRNDGGRFRDVADTSATEDIASGMSVAWGDVNRDGWMDLYVSNMFSAAGNRVAFQRHFQEDAHQQVRSNLQRLARGNTLFLNAGGGTFLDNSEAAHVTMGRWAWGSVLTDINNDGWLDVLVANGHITNEKPDDL